MKALVNTAPGTLELLEWPQPAPGPGQVRIQTLACGICSTDLQMIAGWERTGHPAIPGHEWFGRIDAVGEGVASRQVGQRCVAENVLADGGEVGFEHPGGYGEYLLTEARNLHILPEGFPAETGILIEPLAVCVHALRRLRLAGRDGALVFGDGPIGLLLLMLLKHAGLADVALVGGFPNRLALAKSLGASRVVDYHELNAAHPGDLRRVLGSYTTIIEASGAALALEFAMAASGHGGQIVVMGDYGSARAGFPWNALLHGEIELIGSNASAGAWPEAVHLALEGSLPLGELVTHRFPVERFAGGIELVARKKDECVKVMLDWEDEAG